MICKYNAVSRTPTKSWIWKYGNVEYENMWIYHGLIQESSIPANYLFGAIDGPWYICSTPYLGIALQG